MAIWCARSTNSRLAIRRPMPPEWRRRRRRPRKPATSMTSGFFSTGSPQGGRVLLSAALLGLLGTGAAMAQLPARPVIDPARELVAIKTASDLDDSPADSQAVQQVCTACHSSSQFLGTPRSSSRWEQVFGQMAQQGARPNEEQIDRIERYFQRNLIVVNVNTSPDEELGPTLQTTPEVT